MTNCEKTFKLYYTIFNLTSLVNFAAEHQSVLMNSSRENLVTSFLQV